MDCVYHQIENTQTYEFVTNLLQQADATECVSHFHKNYEILSVVQGSCTCRIGDKIYQMGEGDFVLLFPFQIHACAVEANSVVRQVILHDQLIWSLASSLSGKLPQKASFQPSKAQKDFFLTELDAMFGTAKYCAKRMPTAERMMVKGLLYMIGASFFSQAEFVTAQRADRVLSQVICYLSERFRQDLTLGEIAQACGYSYHYLSRLFNRVFGVNFKTMLNQYRLEHAHFLLQDTDLPIGRIAFESGFQSIRSFDHACRQLFGCAPKELRSRHKNSK